MSEDNFYKGALIGTAIILPLLDPRVLVAAMSELWDANDEIKRLVAHIETMETTLAWELNILEQEIRPVIKPLKREWLEMRIKRLRATLETKP